MSRESTTLLIDNYDSFTFNLFQLIADIDGAPPVVIENDQYDRWWEIRLEQFDRIVISPGPGRPDTERDFGISRLAFEQTILPVLGICLGHQGLCAYFGGKVDLAPEPMHGRLSEVHHDARGLFADIPSPICVVRYHSLTVYDPPEDELEVTARTEDGVIMAVRHRSRPFWGVQFHPESISTEHGRRLLENFRDLSMVDRSDLTSTDPNRARLHVHALESAPVAERVEDLVARDGTYFWLDSSLVIDGLSRFSVLGGCGGPLARLVEYWVGTGEVTETWCANGARTRYRESLFDYLERETARLAVPDPGLPFDFALGFVGYLGYEMKADCGGRDVHRSASPDGYVLFVDRAVVLDHRDGQVWLLALAIDGATDRAARRWLADTERELVDTAEAIPTPDLAVRCPANDAAVTPPEQMALRGRHTAETYLELIAACQRNIDDGETYELCLTNELKSPQLIDPQTVYRQLRRANPAPYSAHLSFPGISVLSLSPERFLHIDRTRHMECKPIKGTRPRSSDSVEDARLRAELAGAEKDRAENLMIVDLVRNDLGRVAKINSVHVPTLFGIESYATVHQMVSTVHAQLREDLSPVAAVRAAFPGGSMTGAPKLRAMEILDGLEQGPRGVYSGALGYFSLNGAVDLSIVIRTLVQAEDGVRVGAGGAIVALSDPEEELEETIVKAGALLRLLGQDPATAVRSGLDARGS